MKIELEGKNKNIKKVILTDSQIITVDENNEKNIYSLNKQSSVNVKVGDTVYS